MNFLSNLKIGTRLGLAFALVLFITTAVSSIGVWRIGSLNDTSKQITTIELERTIFCRNGGPHRSTSTG